MQDRADNKSPPPAVEAEEKNTPLVEEYEIDDWADNESVTTDDGESTDPPSKKNIHLRRWKLISKDNDTFVIEGGRRPKELNMSPLESEFFSDQKHLLEADFVL